MKSGRFVRLIWLGLLTLGPAVALAAGGGHGSGHGVPEHVPYNVWFQFANLAVLMYLLYRAVRLPLVNHLARRQDIISDALESAEETRIKAEKRRAEVDARLARLADEIGRLKAEAEEDARAQAQRILASARAAVERVDADTQRVISDELARARFKLRQETIELAVELASRQVAQQLVKTDHARLADEYVTFLRKQNTPSTEMH